MEPDTPSVCSWGPYEGILSACQPCGVWPYHTASSITTDRIASARAKVQDNEFTVCLKRKSWCYILLVCNDLAILLWGRERQCTETTLATEIMMSISCQIQQTPTVIVSNHRIDTPISFRNNTQRACLLACPGTHALP